MNPIIFQYESASAKIRLYETYGIVGNVLSKLRGRGHATKLMELIVEYADTHDLILMLEVDPSTRLPPETILDVHQLQAFYEKFGFERLPVRRPITMTREPSRK